MGPIRQCADTSNSYIISRIVGARSLNTTASFSHAQNYPRDHHFITYAS